MANWTSQLTSELEEVKEITHKNHGRGPGIWKNDADVHHCPICEKEFTISRRKVLQYRVSNMDWRQFSTVQFPKITAIPQLT